MTRILLLVLIISGGWQLGSGSWIWAKARLAQWLLESSWSEMLQQQDHHSIKPWPWADTHATARLEVPALNVSMIVLQGDSGRTLAFGPGHSSDSAAPGEPGTTVISGHRDTHFAFLQQLKPGIGLQLQTLQGEWRYRVLETQVVDSRNGGVSVPDDQHGLLLVTCYPFEALEPGGPLRYLVWAEPDSTHPLTSQAKTDNKTII
ncbi:MAG: class GN sortase [Halopseudomonas sp.]